MVKTGGLLGKIRVAPRTGVLKKERAVDRPKQVYNKKYYLEKATVLY